MALKDQKREVLDALAEQNGINPENYSNKDDLALALESAGVEAPSSDESAQSVRETDEPRDPTQAIPESALPRYLNEQPAGAPPQAPERTPEEAQQERDAAQEQREAEQSV